MKKYTLLYLLMALWMFLGSSVGAAEYLCRASCCRPVVLGVHADHGGEGSCGYGYSSPEAEAIAFFAEETGGLDAASLSVDPLFMEADLDCLPRLTKTVEYAPQRYTHGVHLAQVAAHVRHVSPIDPALDSFVDFSPVLSPLPPGLPPTLNKISFLC